MIPLTETRPRAPAWAALTVFSVVALIAHTTQAHRLLWKQHEFEIDWSLAMIALSFILSCLASMIHIAVESREERGDTVEWRGFETFLTIVVLLVWILGIPVITAPENNLAVSFVHVINANLYFSSWAAFATALYIGEHLRRERYPVSTPQGEWTKRWFFLILSSTVVLVSCYDLNQKAGCDSYYNFLHHAVNDYCQDLQIGVVLSCCSIVEAIGLSLLLGFGPQQKRIVIRIAFCAAVVVLGMWAICIAYLTFGHGPASAAGNLFFGTWASFLLGLDLVISHTQHRFGGGNENDEADSDKTTNREGEQHPDNTEATTETHTAIAEP